MISVNWRDVKVVLLSVYDLVIGLLCSHSKWASVGFPTSVSILAKPKDNFV